MSPEDIKSALRRVTLLGLGVPVVCGSARRNKAVQPLLDAVVNFLPSPQNREGVALISSAANKKGDDKQLAPLPPLATGPLCGLVFKVHACQTFACALTRSI